MSDTPDIDALDRPRPATKREETLAFLTLAVFIWPFIAIAAVGGLGFLIWMSQLVLGPPGPPH